MPGEFVSIFWRNMGGGVADASGNIPDLARDAWLRIAGKKAGAVAPAQPDCTNGPVLDNQMPNPAGYWGQWQNKADFMSNKKGMCDEAYGILKGYVGNITTTTTEDSDIFSNPLAFSLLQSVQTGNLCDLIQSAAIFPLIAGNLGDTSDLINLDFLGPLFSDCDKTAPDPNDPNRTVYTNKNRFMCRVSRAQGMAGMLRSSGLCGRTGGTGAALYSDERLKKNIEDQSLDAALQRVMRLRPVEFDWRDNSPYPGRHSTGLIAQQVETVVPEAVHHVGGVKRIEIGPMINTLIEAVKAQQRQIDRLGQAA
jgi:hypothetical protein